MKSFLTACALILLAACVRGADDDIFNLVRPNRPEALAFAKTYEPERAERAARPSRPAAKYMTYKDAVSYARRQSGPVTVTVAKGLSESRVRQEADSAKRDGRVFALATDEDEVPQGITDEVYGTPAAAPAPAQQAAPAAPAAPAATPTQPQSRAGYEPVWVCEGGSCRQVTPKFPKPPGQGWKYENKNDSWYRDVTAGEVQSAQQLAQPAAAAAPAQAQTWTYATPQVQYQYVQPQYLSPRYGYSYGSCSGGACSGGSCSGGSCSSGACSGGSCSSGMCGSGGCSSCGR